VELYPLPGALTGPGLGRAVAEGRARVLRRGPRTLGEVLAEAAAAMDDEDQAEEYAKDPVTWLRAHRPPRNLWERLFG
jgi:hypothetical protein